MLKKKKKKCSNVAKRRPLKPFQYSSPPYPQRIHSKTPSRSLNPQYYSTLHLLVCLFVFITHIPFYLKAAFYGFPLAYLNCQLLCFGAIIKQNKGYLNTCTAIPHSQLVTETSAKRLVGGQVAYTAWTAERIPTRDKVEQHKISSYYSERCTIYNRFTSGTFHLICSECG